MTFLDMLHLIRYWTHYGDDGGPTERHMIRAIVRETACRQALEQRVAELEAQLFADRQRLVKLSEDADTVLFDLHPATTPGAINWGDLCAREVQRVWAHDDGVHRYRIVIDEADPVNPALHAAVLAGLAGLGWDVSELEIVTEW